MANCCISEHVLGVAVCVDVSGRMVEWVNVSSREGGEEMESLIAKASAHFFIVYPSSSDAKKWPTEKQFSPKSTPTKKPSTAKEHVVKPQKKITQHPVNHKESGVF